MGAPWKQPNADGRTVAGQVPDRRPQLGGGGLRASGGGPAETGRGPLLDARRTAIRSGLLVGGAFPPAGCLTASAGFGAEPHGFQGVGTAPNNLIQGNKVPHPSPARLSEGFFS